MIELSKGSELKPQRDGFIPVISEKSEKSSFYQHAKKEAEEKEELKHPDEEAKQNAGTENRPSGGTPNRKSNEAMRKSIDKTTKEESPVKKIEQM